MLWCSFLCALGAWVLWNILDLCVYSFYQIWKSFGIIFFCPLLPLGFQLHVYYVVLSCHPDALLISFPVFILSVFHFGEFLLLCLQVP